MDHSAQRITDLEARITKYEQELDAASTAEEKQRISGLIKSRTETLNNLLINERKALPQGIGIHIRAVKFIFMLSYYFRCEPFIFWCS